MRGLILSGSLLLAGLLHAQTSYAPRVNFGARLEPQGVLVHGAGQDPADYANYWNAMPIGRQPQVYMYYIDLDTLAPNWADALKAQLLVYPGNFVIPQIGLSMTDSVTDHYEAQVAAGAYDTQIGYLVSGLQELANPVYLRIGYEFNGLTYIHITNMLRAASPAIEVATVWDAEVDGATDFMDYYPGDQYVDWFGMNVFNDSSFSNPILPTFMNLANSHNKPVMIGETTPATVGAQGGAASWNGWFADFFQFLQTTPEIKEFNYIDYNWANWTQGGVETTWGDSRLDIPTAAYVLNLYLEQLAQPPMLSGASETSFRQLLGYNDTTPPPAVTGLSVSSAPGGVTLTWTPVTDPSGIGRYYLYRNGTLLDFSLAPPYTDLSVGLGTSTYTIAAMDRAGNLSPSSAEQTINLTQIQRINNGGFENGLSGWQLSSYASGAVGTAVIDTTNPIDGTASVKINVSQTTGTNWNLQLEQFFQITSGLTYTVSFKARASATVTLPFAIQQTPSPYAVYLNPNFTVTTTAASFSYSFTANASQPVEIGFWVDDIGSATLWLDDISVVESNSGKSDPPNLLSSGVQNGASYVPGAAPGSWLAIKGVNLAEVASDTWANAIVNGVLPQSLDGVSVSLGGQPAYIYYVSADQINVIAPNASPGPQPLTLTTPGGTTAPVTVNVGAQAPAFFLWPGNQAVATRAADGSYAVKAGTFSGATTVAAHPGDVLILWGTGFGATTPAFPQGVEIPATQQYNCSPVTAMLGTASVTVYGCALSPGSAALYQVAIQVPSPLPDGDYALTVAVNGAVSPSGVILSVTN